MLRISEIHGLRAVAEKTGRRLGLVERVCLSADGQDVPGLILRLFGLTRRKRFVSFEDIILWGQVSVTVRALKKPAACSSREEILGASVLDTSGGRLGWVTDAAIDQETGRVLGLEVSRGYADDLISGRFRVCAFTMRPGGVVVAVTDPSGEEDFSFPEEP